MILRILVTIVVVVLGFGIVSFLINYWKKRAIKKSLKGFAGGYIRAFSATTPEEIFENNFALWQEDDPKEAAEYLHWWIMQALVAEKQPRKVDIERLKKLGRLKAVDASGLALFPDAAYEMQQVDRARVFFRKDLTLAGFKDYRLEIEE